GCHCWVWGRAAVEENADSNLWRPAGRASARSQQLQGTASCGWKENKKGQCASRDRAWGFRGHNSFEYGSRSSADWCTRDRRSCSRFAEGWSARLLLVDQGEKIFSGSRGFATRRRQEKTDLVFKFLCER